MLMMMMMVAMAMFSHFLKIYLVVHFPQISAVVRRKKKRLDGRKQTSTYVSTYYIYKLIDAPQWQHQCASKRWKRGTEWNQTSGMAYRIGMASNSMCYGLSPDQLAYCVPGVKYGIMAVFCWDGVMMSWHTDMPRGVGVGLFALRPAETRRQKKRRKKKAVIPSSLKFKCTAVDYY